MCVVRYTYLPRADPLSRGVLLSVVCHCVWSRNITNEAAAPSLGCCFRKNTTDQCTCDVTLRRFHKSLLPWKCNKYYVFACVSARACVVCPGAWACACACVHRASLIQHATCVRHIVTSFVAPLYPPYFRDVINRTTVEKKLLNIKCVF